MHLLRSALPIKLQWGQQVSGSGFFLSMAFLLVSFLEQTPSAAPSDATITLESEPKGLFHALRAEFEFSADAFGKHS